MALKKIQIRGISRTPSDNMTEDGGVAESLNAYLDNGEQAPAIAPEDVTAELGLPQGSFVERIFIHKTLHYINYLWVSEGKVYYKNNAVLTLPAGESVVDIANLGNVLVVATNSNLYYLLYDAGTHGYTVQGNGIPLPTVMVTTRENSVINEEVLVHQSFTTNQPNQDMKFSNNWNDVKDGENINTYAGYVAASVRGKAEAYNPSNGFAKPMVMRYALRLYNNTLITSVPYLVGAGYLNTFKSIAARYEFDEGYDNSDNPQNQEQIRVTLTKGSYKPYVKMLDFPEEQLASWKDIVKSIDIYVSTPIKSDLSVVQVRDVVDGYDEAIANIDMGLEEDVEKRILEKSVFYKVASYDLTKEEEVSRLRAGETLEVPSSEDELLKNERLDPLLDNMMPDTLIPSRMSTYNASLLIAGASTRLTSGSRTMMATEGITSGNHIWTVRYLINANTGSASVLARDEKDSIYIAGPTAYAWIVHPNVNCTMAEICTDETDVVEVPMKPHPYLPCSYGYLGRKTLIGYTHEDEQFALSIRGRKESNTISQENKVFMSETENPYIFPLVRRYTFQAKVLNVAIATSALSQGQFGQYPLYAFTEDGIWAMETGVDGSFVSSKPLSREVCVNGDSVTSLDNAVVFVTTKGVMLLQGSQVTELSPYMNGRHYVVEETAKNLIKCQSGFCDFLDVLSDATPFMEYIKKSSIAYDYAGKRLIFVNPDEAYQYIYKLDTSTWHKICHKVTLVQALNSYPDCYISAKDEFGATSVLNFSTILDSSQKQYTERMVIATRPFDLDHPHNFKSISDVKIRGQFPRGMVKFILLGSNDGIHYYTVSTLRGRSWKQFRLIILADLEQYDRLSWIEIMYQVRYINTGLK